jgi:hypothetical protein
VEYKGAQGRSINHINGQVTGDTISVYPLIQSLIISRGNHHSLVLQPVSRIIPAQHLPLVRLKQLFKLRVNLMGHQGNPGTGTHQQAGFAQPDIATTDQEYRAALQIKK